MVRNWSRQRCHSKVKHSEDLPRPSRNSLLWMLRTILFSRLTKFNFKLPIKNIEMLIGSSLTHFVSYRNRPSIRLASNVCYNFTVTIVHANLWCSYGNTDELASSLHDCWHAFILIFCLVLVLVKWQFVTVNQPPKASGNCGYSTCRSAHDQSSTSSFKLFSVCLKKIVLDIQRTLTYFILPHIVPLSPTHIDGRKEGEAVSYLSQVVYRNICYRSDKRPGLVAFNLFGFRFVVNQALQYNGNRVGDCLEPNGLNIQFVNVVLYFEFLEKNKAETQS